MTCRTWRAGDGGTGWRMRARHRLHEPETAVDRASDDEIVALLRACRSARDRLIVLLMARAGLRRGEVLGLRRSDVHLLADSRALGCDDRRGRTCTWCAGGQPERGVWPSPVASGRCRWISWWCRRSTATSSSGWRCRRAAGQRLRVRQPVPRAAGRADAAGRDQRTVTAAARAGRDWPAL